MCKRQIKRQWKWGSERGHAEKAEKGGLSGDRECGQLSLCATIDPFLRTGKLSGPTKIYDKRWKYARRNQSSENKGYALISRMITFIEKITNTRIAFRNFNEIES